MEARSELAAGRPAYALALGLYLHWRDADEVREDAGALLRDAYRALDGGGVFADILELHLKHRDRTGVGVFEPL